MTTPQGLREPRHHRVVVRGTGSIGSRHLRVLRDHLGVAALAAPVRTGGGEALREEGFPVAGNAAEVAAFAPTAAVVATDTIRHLPDAAELLAYGPVLVEKPLAPALAGIGRLSAEAAARQRACYVAFCLRFDPGLQWFRSVLPVLGQVDTVRIECQSYLPSWRPGSDHRTLYCARAEEGGVLRDLAHEIDYAVWLFGRPGEVLCLLSSSGRLQINSEEGADLLWVAPGGATVSLRLDYLARAPRRRLRACGEHGELEWDAVAGTVTLTRAGESAEVRSFPPDRDQMLARQARSFLAAADGGDPGALATLEEGAFVVALSDAARESSRARRFVPVPDWRAS